MNWALILLAWVLGRWSTRDLTTWAPPSSGPSAPPPAASPRPRPASPRPRPRPATTPASYPAPSAPPWPQVVPGLPAFPSGWEPDSPVGAGVAARALELLPELWSYGAGTRKTEQTAGRWITYVATPMAAGKRGVVAYRMRPGNVWEAPSASTAPGDGETAFASSKDFAPGSRTLRDEERPQGTDVSYLQGRLGVPATGVYDATTVAAVRAYQREHPPLRDDGDVGPLTWQSLFAASA